MSPAFEEAQRIAAAWFGVSFEHALTDFAGAERMRELLPGINPRDIDELIETHLREHGENACHPSWLVQLGLACVIAGVITERDR